jgi:hypothetical protein
MAKSKSEYSQKLLDPRWQKKRLEILSRDEFECQICCETTKTLHVHHKIYFKGKEPWEITNEYLTTLCRDCHEEEPRRKSEALKELSEWINKYNSNEIESLTYLLNCIPALTMSRTLSILSFAMGFKELLLALEEWENKCINAGKELPFHVNTKGC